MSHRNSFTEDYEFTVCKGSRMGVISGYSVSLPHQCSEWEIVGADAEDAENNGGYPALPLSKELAVKQMKLFVVRAQEALEKLENL